MLERISQARVFPVALIVAPAGYGKSVALRQYLETLDEPHVRFDMAPEHETLPGFLRGFADALRDVAPHMSLTLADALRGAAAGTDLVAWLSAHLQEFRGVIAVDDLQHAHDPEVFAFLRAAIGQMNGRVTWIIASRSTPDLPIATWMTYGDMDLPVDERDLAFTLDEVRNASEGTGAGDEELARFVEMTGGWATALSFAMRSRVRTSELAAIGSDTREMVYRYLAEQVYVQLSECEREMMHVAAYMPVIDVDMLLDAGFADAFAMLEKLRKRVAFLSVEEQRKYRCHDLFREFLQHQVQLLGEEAANSVQLRAASAFEERGDVVAALRLYSTLQSEDAILRLLEKHGFDLLDKAHRDVIDAAIAALSPGALGAAAIASGMRGAREADVGRLDRAEALYKKAIEKTADPVLRAELALRLASLLFAQSRDVVGVLEPLLRETLPDAIHAKAISLLAPAYAYAGRFDDARAAMALAQQHAVSVDSDELRARLLHRMGLASLALGLPFEQMHECFSQAERLATAKGLYYTAAAALNGVATSTYMYDMDAVKLASRIPRLIDLAVKAGDIHTFQKAVVVAIDAEAKRGDFERVLHFEQRFSDISTSDKGATSLVNPVRALRSAYQGDFEEAYRLSRGNVSYYNFDRVLAKAMCAIYALAINLREPALEMVRETLAEIENEQFDFPHARCCAEIARLLCGLIEALSGRAIAARRVIRKPPLIENGAVQALRTLVRRTADQSERPGALDAAMLVVRLAEVGQAGLAKVLARVLEAVVPEHAVSRVLTAAELEVLRELDEGRTPKEIAAETGRSVHTVRTLIQRATERLGCSGRQQALALARSRGWLEGTQPRGGSSALA